MNNITFLKKNLVTIIIVSIFNIMIFLWFFKSLKNTKTNKVFYPHLEKESEELTSLKTEYTMETCNPKLKITSVIFEKIKSNFLNKNMFNIISITSPAAEG
jgi:hypothetical protein